MALDSPRLRLGFVSERAAVRGAHGVSFRGLGGHACMVGSPMGLGPLICMRELALRRDNDDACAHTCVGGLGFRNAGWLQGGTEAVTGAWAARTAGMGGERSLRDLVPRPADL